MIILPQLRGAGCMNCAWCCASGGFLQELSLPVSHLPQQPQFPCF